MLLGIGSKLFKMKKTVLLILAMTFCFYSFCQMKDSGPKSISSESFVNDNVAPAIGDTLPSTELQQLNMQLRELNVQLADYRNDIALMCHRRQSSMIQAVAGMVVGTTGYVWMANQGNHQSPGGPAVLMVAGGVLCISSLITWICSYTPLANCEVEVTPEGFVYRF